MKIIMVLLIALSSTGVLASGDYDSASIELDSLTQIITKSYFENNEIVIYDTYLHASVKNLVSLAQLEKLGARYRDRLGKFNTARKKQLKFSNTDQGLLAEAVYSGSFDKTNANIDIKALYSDDKWTITFFAITSPLLRDTPDTARKTSELFVTDSDVIITGGIGKLVTKDDTGKEIVLLDEVRISTARWKMSDTVRKKGFVTFYLPEDVEARIKKITNLSLRSMK